jgi:hypothetical protein
MKAVEDVVILVTRTTNGTLPLARADVNCRSEPSDVPESYEQDKPRLKSPVAFNATHILALLNAICWTDFARRRNDKYALSILMNFLRPFIKMLIMLPRAAAC